MRSREGEHRHHFIGVVFCKHTRDKTAPTVGDYQKLLCRRGEPLGGVTLGASRFKLIDKFSCVVRRVFSRPAEVIAHWPSIGIVKKPPELITVLEIQSAILGPFDKTVPSGILWLFVRARAVDEDYRHRARPGDLA